MFGSSTEEVTTDSNVTEQGGHTWAVSPYDRSGLNDTTSYGPASASSSSSRQSLDEGSTSSSHGPSLPRIASGDVMDRQSSFNFTTSRVKPQLMRLKTVNCCHSLVMN